MLKKIKKEHIILIVLVIVVLLLIFINIKNKRVLKEGYAAIGQTTTATINTVAPPRQPDTHPYKEIIHNNNSIGIITHNYNNNNNDKYIIELLYFQDQNIKKININVTMTGDGTNYNEDPTYNEDLTYNKKQSNMPSLEMNSYTGPQYTIEEIYTTDKPEFKFLIIPPFKDKDIIKYLNKNENEQYFFRYHDMYNNNTNKDFNDKYLIEKYNNIYGESINLNPNTDSISEGKIENYIDFINLEAGKEVDNLKIKLEKAEAERNEAVEQRNKVIKRTKETEEILKNTNNIDSENGMIRQLATTFIGNYTVEHFELPEGNCTKLVRLNYELTILNNNKSNVGTEFSKEIDPTNDSDLSKIMTTYRNNINDLIIYTDTPITIDASTSIDLIAGFHNIKGKWTDLWEEMNSKNESIYTVDYKKNENIKYIRGRYLVKLNQIFTINQNINSKNIEIETEKAKTQPTMEVCGNLNNLNTSVKNNEKFRGNYLVENFNSCSKKDRLEKELAQVNEDYVKEQNKYWRSRPYLDNFLQSLMVRKSIADQEAFKKLPNDHIAKIVWYDEQKKVMGEYMRLEKKKMELENEISITPAPTMEDCPTSPQAQEDNEICPGPSPECSDNTAVGAVVGAPVKFRITDFNSLGLTNKIEEKMKTILGTEITFTYDEVKFYFTITINGKKLDDHIQIKEKREHIKNVMTDIYYKHLQKLYISSGKTKEMYNIPKERIRVFVLHGSLKIILEILSEEYAQGLIDTPPEEQDLSDIEEWKQFMSTFNMPGGTENIVQYEPEGVSGIFAPYIKIV